jgi:hypothetical protein
MTSPMGHFMGGVPRSRSATILLVTRL